MLKLQPDDLRLTAIYGLVVSASAILCGSPLGRWIDATRRITGNLLVF